MKAILLSAAMLLAFASVGRAQFVAVDESRPVVLTTTTNGISHVLDQRLYNRGKGGSFECGWARKDSLFSRVMAVEVWDSGTTLKIVDHDNSRWAIYSGSNSTTFPKTMTLGISNGSAPDWIGGSWPATIVLTE